MTHRFDLTRRTLMTTGLSGLAASALTPRSALAVDLDISDGNFQPIPIALPIFSGDPQVAADISNVVTADLRRSGLFITLNPASFIDKGVTLDQVPNFPNWKAINAQALVVGAANRTADGRYQVAFRLWDIFSGRALAGQQFATTAENWRRIAHKVADQIYSRLTGEKPYFDTRVVYVDETGPKTNRVRRLAIMDQDGANARMITKGSEMVAAPQFAPSQQLLTYMAYGADEPKVYMLNLETGQRNMVGNFPGMSTAPRFAPSGQSLLMSLERNGISNIYQTDLSGGNAVRLTDSVSIDTSPCYSPDGRAFAFESDRSGTQQIYVASASGGPAQRISFGSGRYATPAWSPRGDLIAFTKIGGGAFSIGVMKPDGSGERILTESYHNEGPTWAPNGRVIMFYRSAGASSQLYTIDLTGRNEQLISTPNGASGPAWSPLLP